MKTVRVDLGRRSYDVLIGSGMFARISRFFSTYGIGRRLFLVSNRPVFQLFGEAILEQLRKAAFEVTEILIPDGEEHKNLETVQKVYTSLVDRKADRSSTLVAIGGGVVGDIGGFVAATFLRGISYLQIPTTLLSQVDSSVGGKTGVNLSSGKNLIGSFYQPHLVCVDTDTLATLPTREFQSGLYEVLKYGLIYDRTFFEYFERRLIDIQQRKSKVLVEVISRCCEIKGEVISKDEGEKDLRRILNFGHTFGHALEAAVGFRGLTHGEAIAYGMLAATSLSHQQGLLDVSTRDRIIRCIRRVGKLPSIHSIGARIVREAMQRDKKCQNGRVVFVLLQDIGKTSFRDNIQEQTLNEMCEQLTLNVQKGNAF